MTAFLSCLRGLLAISCIAVSAVSQASAAGWLEKGIYLIGPRYDGVLPPCEAAQLRRAQPHRAAARHHIGDR